MRPAASATPSPKRWARPASGSIGWPSARSPEAASRKNCSTASGSPRTTSLPLCVRSGRSRAADLLRLRLLFRRQDLEDVGVNTRTRHRQVGFDRGQFGRPGADEALIERRRGGRRVERLTGCHRPLADRACLSFPRLDDRPYLLALRFGQIELPQRESAERSHRAARSRRVRRPGPPNPGPPRRPSVRRRLILLIARDRQRRGAEPHRQQGRANRRPNPCHALVIIVCPLLQSRCAGSDLPAACSIHWTGWM